MPLERPEETQGQKNVSDKTSPPELLTDTPDFTTESRTFLPSDKDNSPTEHAARTRNSSGEEARDKNLRSSPLPKYPTGRAQERGPLAGGRTGMALAPDSFPGADVCGF